MGKKAIRYMGLGKIIDRHYRASKKKDKKMVFYLYSRSGLTGIQLKEEGYGNDEIFLFKDENKENKDKVKIKFKFDLISREWYYSPAVNLQEIFKLLANDCKELKNLIDKKKVMIKLSALRDGV